MKTKERDPYDVERESVPIDGSIPYPLATIKRYKETMRLLTPKERAQHRKSSLVDSAITVGTFGSLLAAANIAGHGVEALHHSSSVPTPLEQPAPKAHASESHMTARIKVPSHEAVADIMARARYNPEPVHEVGPNGPMIEQFGDHPSQPHN